MAKLSTPSHPCETVNPTWTIDNREVGRRWIGNIPCRFLAYRRTDGRYLCRSCARAVRAGQVRHTAASAAAYLAEDMIAAERREATERAAALSMGIPTVGAR